MKKNFVKIILFVGLFILCDRTLAYNNYSEGDKVTYNGVEYYVIENSDDNSDTVKLFKVTPLSVAEVNEYGVGHVNKYTITSKGTVFDNNDLGYGGMAYYSSETCGHIDGAFIETGCTNKYEDSDIKYVVDAWANDKVGSYEEARLITMDELKNNLGYNHATFDASYYRVNSEYTPEWVYNPTFFWTMTGLDDSTSKVWYLADHGTIYSTDVSIYNWAVRPVVVMKKDVIENKNTVLTDDSGSGSITQADEKGDNVKVPNTMQKVSIIFTMVGVVLMSMGLVILFKYKDKIKNR